MSASKDSLSANLNAFLDLITFSELGAGLITPATDSGYKVIVGSTPKHPILMVTYADHPRMKVWQKRLQKYSTAAGAGQCMEHNWDVYRVQLHLPDFGPESQDKIKIQLIRECHALPLIEAGLIERAICACSSRWASFPRHEGDEDGAYGQGANHITGLLSVYRTFGGWTVG